MICENIKGGNKSPINRFFPCFVFQLCTVMKSFLTWRAYRSEWQNKVPVTCSPDKSTKTETRKNLPVLDKKGDEEKLDTDSVNSEESFDSFSQSHSYNSLSYLLLLSLCRALWRIFRAKMYFSPLK